MVRACVEIARAKHISKDGDAQDFTCGAVAHEKPSGDAMVQIWNAPVELSPCAEPLDIGKVCATGANGATGALGWANKTMRQ